MDSFFFYDTHNYACCKTNFGCLKTNDSYRKVVISLVKHNLSSECALVMFEKKMDLKCYLQ